MRYLERQNRFKLSSTYSKISKLISFEKFNNFALLNPLGLVNADTEPPKYCVPNGSTGKVATWGVLIYSWNVTFFCYISGFVHWLIQLN